MSAEFAIAKWLAATKRQKVTKADVEVRCAAWWMDKGLIYQPSTLTRAFQRLIDPGGMLHGKARWETGKRGRRTYRFPRISKQQLKDFQPVQH